MIKSVGCYYLHYHKPIKIHAITPPPKKKTPLRQLTKFTFFIYIYIHTRVCV